MPLFFCASWRRHTIAVAWTYLGRRGSQQQEEDPNGWIRSRRKRATVGVALAALVMTISIVSPALGGPSLTTVAKNAKKALSTAKKADRRARHREQSR